MKLEHTLSIHQQQALVDEVVISAIKQGIIKDDKLISRPEMIHHLVVCLGEANNPRKKVVLFTEGVIHPSGKCAWLSVVAHPGTTGEEIKTSIPVTPYTEGVEQLSWFETINTIYVMAVGGKPVQDLRGIKAESEG